MQIPEISLFNYRFFCHIIFWLCDNVVFINYFALIENECYFKFKCICTHIEQNIISSLNVYIHLLNSLLFSVKLSSLVFTSRSQPKQPTGRPFDGLFQLGNVSMPFATVIVHHIGGGKSACPRPTWEYIVPIY